MFTLKSLVSIVSITALVAAVPVPSDTENTLICECPGDISGLAQKVCDKFQDREPQLTDLPITNEQFCIWLNKQRTFSGPTPNIIARDLQAYIRSVTKPEFQRLDAKADPEDIEEEDFKRVSKVLKGPKLGDKKDFHQLDGDDDQTFDPENELRRQDAIRKWVTDKDGLLVPHNSPVKSSKWKEPVQRKNALTDKDLKAFGFQRSGAFNENDLDSDDELKKLLNEKKPLQRKLAFNENDKDQDEEIEKFLNEQ